MYFSGSEFHNKFLAMGGIYKTKNWFPKEDKHRSNRKQIFFGPKAKLFSVQSNVNSTLRLIFGIQQHSTFLAIFASTNDVIT